MSSRNPVLWPEGLFVKPQHFQQAARAAEAALHQRLGSLNAAFYGFSELQLNDEYLSLGKVAITRARGIMPDGTVFDIPADMPPPPPLEIEDDGAKDSEIYLCLPLRTEGGREVSWPDNPANFRYSAQAQEIKDTHSADGDLVQIDLAVPNLQLKRKADDSSAYTRLAVTRILERRPDGSLQLDEGFYPTSVSVRAVPALQRYLEEITNSLRERARNLAARIGASYGLCLFIDEAVMDRPWGKTSCWSQEPLLSIFHDETWGGEKVFTVLSRLMQEPKRYKDVLEFMYFALCLGLKGKYAIAPSPHTAQLTLRN